MQVIIPAAGLGTRMLPFTKDISKVMIRLNGKPFLSYIIDELKKINNYKTISNIFIIENTDKRDITLFVEELKQKDDFYKRIEVRKQIQYPGPLGAIYEVIKNFNKKYDILIWLGDTLLDTSKKKFDFSKSFVTVSDVKNTVNWCMINSKNTIKDKKDFDNNQNPKYYALNGVYFIKNMYPDLIKFENLKMINEEYQISSLLKRVIKSENKFRLEKSFDWYDIGNHENYKKTKNYLIKSKARGSNDISFSDDDVFIIKRGKNEKAVIKIMREKYWYDQTVELNPSCCGIIPKSFITQDCSLYMTNEKGELLSDLILYDTNNISIWKFILGELIKTYITYFYRPIDLNKHSNIERYFYLANKELFYKDINERLKLMPFNITAEQIEKITKTYNIICNKILSNKQMLTEIMHGDLHLGNILFDMSTMKFIFIDPRALFGSEKNRFKYCCYGNITYDVAKLCHDFFGYYLFLNLGIEPTKKQQDFLNELGKYMIEVFKKHLDCLENFELEDFKFLGNLFVLNVVPIHYKESREIAKIMFDYSLSKILELCS